MWRRVVLLPLLAFGLYDVAKTIEYPELRSLIESGEGVLVKFFLSYCPPCKAFAPEFERAALSLNGIIKVVTVEGRPPEGDFDITSFPTVHLYLQGALKAVYESDRTAESVAGFVLDTYRHAIVMSLTDGEGLEPQQTTTPPPPPPTPPPTQAPVVDKVVDLNTNSFMSARKDPDNIWFILFYAPWCGHCKSMMPAWMELGKEGMDSVRIGRVDAVAEASLAHEYGIKGYPTILLFKPGMPTPITYQGERSLPGFKGFLGEHRTPKITRVDSQEIFDKQCAKTCIMVILPDDRDVTEAKQNENLGILKDLSRRTSHLPTSINYLYAGEQYSLEERLHLQFGYPAVIAISKKTNVFATHRGSFTVVSLREFVDKMITGGLYAEDLPSLPKIKTIKKKEYIKSDL